MNDLPEDLAKPRSDWQTSDVMGIVVGAALIALAIALGAWVVLT